MPDSQATNYDTHEDVSELKPAGLDPDTAVEDDPSKAQHNEQVQVVDAEDEGDHVVEGDEDSVIY